MIYFTAHTFNCVCHCIRAMFIVLGMYNFAVLYNEITVETRTHLKSVIFTVDIFAVYLKILAGSINSNGT